MGTVAFWRDERVITALLTAFVVFWNQINDVITVLPELDVALVAGIVLFLQTIGVIIRSKDKTKRKLTMFKTTKMAIAFLAFGLLAAPAHADLFSDRSPEMKLKMGAQEESGSKYSSSLIDAGSIADILAAFAGKAGVVEGVIFDFEEEEINNYFASTLWTSPEGISVTLGAVDTDGVAGAVNYNIGQAISHEDVPLLNWFDYVYVGYALGWKDREGGDDTSLEDAGSWKFMHGPSAFVKATW